MESAEAILYQYAWLIPVLPLIGAAVVGMGLISYSDATSKLKQASVYFHRFPDGGGHGAVVPVAVESGAGSRTFTQMIEWASAGDFRLEMGYTIDHLASLMLVIVTTVAFLVMVYTHGYMAHDPGYVRFYAYLSLFRHPCWGW
jgi:NAD(P)H-quinone oxidoreductase subunit 5